MTIRQNTNNPCPSNALADLNDNTIIIDEWVNSTGDYTTDRFGNQFQTKHKILNDLKYSIDEIKNGSFLPISSVHTNENGVPTYKVGCHVVFSDMIGDQRLMPFRANELPFGWYFRNGDNYLLSSPQGQALNSLSANYKNDFCITIKYINGQQYINVPTAFSPDGLGYFERPVNGTTRQVGGVEGDAIRNIVGTYGNVATSYLGGSSAMFTYSFVEGVYVGGVNGYHTTIGFDASREVPTAYENRPINIGMTPAIYLGV